MENTSPLEQVNKFRPQIMGFAALWILFFHMWQPLFSESGVKALFYAENVTKRLGFEGVDFFFLLSGVGLTYSVKKHSLWQFYLRRFKRLAIPFVIIAAIRAVLEHWGWYGFFFVVCGANFFIGNMYFCLWFVTAITVIYLIFPLYWHFFSNSRHKLVFTIAAIAVWYALSVALIGIMKTDMYGFTNRIPVFLIGVFFGWYVQNEKCRLSAGKIIIIAAILTMAGLVLSFLCNFRALEFKLPESNCCLPDLLTATGGSVLLAEFFALLDRSCSLTRAINCALAFIGGISLEFYCVQEYFGGQVVNVLSGNTPNIIVNAAVLIAVTLLAWLLHKLNSYVWLGIENAVKKDKKSRKSQ